MVLAVFASPTSVSVATKSSQTKSGSLTYVYYQTISGPSSSTPNANTAMSPPGGSGSYSIARSSTAYLWTPQFGTATTINAGNWALDLWTACTNFIIGYVPITVNNTQSPQTTSTFQEKVIWNPSNYANYEAADLGNIRFYSDSAFTMQLFAWLESCTPSVSNTSTSAVAWVKLTTAIQGKSATTIYMAFLTTSITYDNIYWGKAPNLSGTYGANDNGANVFSFYDNFIGTTLNASRWTQVKSSFYSSVSINNGSTFTTTYSSGWAFVVSPALTYPLVAEAYLASSSSNVDPMMGVTSSTSSNGAVALYSGYSMDETSSTLTIAAQQSSGGSSVNSSSVSGIRTGIWQLIWSSTGNESASDGVITIKATSSTPTITNYRIYVGQSDTAAGNNVFSWARMRGVAPNNIMPTASLGSLIQSSFTLAVSFYTTDSSGTVLTTIISNLQSVTIGSSKAQYLLKFAGTQVNIPQNAYLSVTLSASPVATYTVYWGSGQPSNFQVPYRTLS